MKRTKEEHEEYKKELDEAYENERLRLLQEKESRDADTARDALDLQEIKMKMQNRINYTQPMEDYNCEILVQDLYFDVVLQKPVYDVEDPLNCYDEEVDLDIFDVPRLKEAMKNRIDEIFKKGEWIELLEITDWKKVTS